MMIAAIVLAPTVANQAAPHATRHATATRSKPTNGSSLRPTADRRVAWVHIPKCGTSFGTTLVHYANASLPEDFAIPTPGSALPRTFPVNVLGFNAWFQGVFWLKGRSEDHNIANHNVISEAVWAQYRGRFFGMFREPLSRARSIYAFFTRALASPLLHLPTPRSSCRRCGCRQWAPAGGFENYSSRVPSWD